MELEEKSYLWIRDIEGIDAETGLVNCGDWDSYASVLKIFLNTAEEKIAEVSALVANKNWEEYKIRMHGMKSSARVIGAEELFERARLLEVAGKEADVAYVDECLDGFLEEYRRLAGKLAPLEENQNTLPPVDEAMLKDAYETLLSAVDAEDSDLAEIVLLEMKNYSLPEGDNDVFRELYKKYLAVDWEGMRKLICREK
ncbi:MAG: Hpt domain-containing protein [Lachnospiraceae bacterium]|nr:Hpt domain-containing protein [Lachnospiraceae bacterium]